MVNMLFENSQKPFEICVGVFLFWFGFIPLEPKAFGFSVCVTQQEKERERERVRMMLNRPRAYTEIMHSVSCTHVKIYGRQKANLNSW